MVQGVRQPRVTFATLQGAVEKLEKAEPKGHGVNVVKGRLAQVGLLLANMGDQNISRAEQAKLQQRVDSVGEEIFW